MRRQRTGGVERGPFVGAAATVLTSKVADEQRHLGHVDSASTGSERHFTPHAVTYPLPVRPYLPVVHTPLARTLTS